MGVRNKRPDLNGVLVVDKPLGVSSAHVCRVIRRVTGGAKVGHAGTLDPLATGVLVLCLGTATKAISAIQDGEKAYDTTIDLSAFTTTEDAEGERTAVPVDTPPIQQHIERVLAGNFHGEIDQTPPAFSAVKVDGKRAYARARAGEDVVIQPKRVRIHRIDITRYEWPTLVISVRCGKGTYIRSIARDLGNALGTGGTLTQLRRTRVGRYGLDHARELESLERGVDATMLTEPQKPAESINTSVD